MQKLLFFILISVSLLGPTWSFASTLSKQQTLSILADWDKELRLNNQNKIDNAISPEISAKEQRENDLEIEFVNRLIFQVERKYQDSDPRKFFKDIIWDMYQTDRLSINKAYGSSELFLKVLHQSLEEILEPQENAVMFIKNFTRFSSIQDPVELEVFASTRNYFDGKVSLEAEPVDANTAAELTEEKLKKEPGLEGYNLLESSQDLRNEFPSF